MKARVAETKMAYVEKYSHDGRGIAKIDGKITFLQGALPQETVLFRYTKRKKDFDEGVVIEVQQSSKDRVAPLCPHFSLCGGCSLQHLAPGAQVQAKEAWLLNMLQRVAHLSPQKVLPPLQNVYWHYRYKARLSVRFVSKKQKILIGFRERNQPRYITEIQSCSILHARVSAQIEGLAALLAQFEDPHRIAQIEVAAGDEEVALILRNLTPITQKEETLLVSFAKETNFRIYLQPGTASTVSLLYPQAGSELLSYTLPEQEIRYSFHPTDFTQINPALNRSMVGQALELLATSSEDIVLDLFCGLGNFSLPIAKKAKKVIGLEGSEVMVWRARSNALQNAISNAEFYPADLSLPNALQPWALASITQILLDPPRSGAWEIVQKLHLLKAKRIVYISCNPATFARDAEVLVQKGYCLQAVGVMDMFPHTAHVESIALFNKE